MKPMPIIHWLCFIIGLITLPACGLGRTAVVEGVGRSVAEPLAEPLATPTTLAVAVVEPLVDPLATPLPSAPAATPTAPTLPTPSLAPTATPSPTPLHPLMIEAMRQQIYPGSEITIEQTLEPGANYGRYVASYLSEGNKIYALLTVPWGETPASGWPVIIFNHGYIPPDEYRTTERYVDYVDAFARSGYIVFRSDYRGHGSSEGDAEGGYGSPAYTIDILNAVAAVKTYPAADSDRIGMWGHSMGGHITLRTMVVSDDIKAGVIWAGVVASYPDLFERWRRGSGDGPTNTPDPTRMSRGWRGRFYETYGSPADNPSFWAAVSPNTYVGDLSGPIQLHHATGDTSVPYEFSESLYAQIQAVGIPAELFIYEGDNHNIATNFYTAMQRSIQFFDAHVKGSQ